MKYNNIELLEKIAKEIIYEDNLKTFDNESPINIAKAIEDLLNENEFLKKENRLLKYHEYTNICQCCKKTFYSKRPNVLWCKNCRTKMHNINYYANLSDEKKRERVEKSKISMRKYRKKIKEGDK